MRRIVQHEHPTLRTKAKEVPLEEIGSKDIQTLLNDMSMALATRADGVALAAPQVDVSKRVFIVSGKVFTKQQDVEVEDLYFINPVVLKKSRRLEVMDEGCLSVVGKYGNVKRHTQVTIEAYNRAGKKIEVIGTGLLGQIFQHEIDHLEGVLYIDKAEEVHDVTNEK